MGVGAEGMPLIIAHFQCGVETLAFFLNAQSVGSLEVGEVQFPGSLASAFPLRECVFQVTMGLVPRPPIHPHELVIDVFQAAFDFGEPGMLAEVAGGAERDETNQGLHAIFVAPDFMVFDGVGGALAAANLALVVGVSIDLSAQGAPGIGGHVVPHIGAEAGRRDKLGRELCFIGVHGPLLEGGHVHATRNIPGAVGLIPAGAEREGAVLVRAWNIDRGAVHGGLLQKSRTPCIGTVAIPGWTTRQLAIGAIP